MGVVIRGIDPAREQSVTDLATNIREGGLERLSEEVAQALRQRRKCLPVFLVS